MEEFIKASDLAKLWIGEAHGDSISLEGVSDIYSDQLSSLIYSDPAEAWKVIKIISASDLSDIAFDSFSMGPLSSFVFHNGLNFKTEINDFWKKSESFREQYKMIVFNDLADELLK